MGKSVLLKRDGLGSNGLGGRSAKGQEGKTAREGRVGGIPLRSSPYPPPSTYSPRRQETYARTPPLKPLTAIGCCMHLESYFPGGNGGNGGWERAMGETRREQATIGGNDAFEIL